MIQPNREGTDYTRAMLMWTCRGGMYYAGQVAGLARCPTQESARIDAFEEVS